MRIDYVDFNKIPNDEILQGILELHTAIFGRPDDLIGRMREKPKLRIDLALADEKVVGYKIGYKQNRDQLYSWLGGVDSAFRNQGIASVLMERQHRYAEEAGYHTIRTETKNKWRSMLLLNIKSGFNIIGTYTDNSGEPKIILEKPLSD